MSTMKHLAQWLDANLRLSTRTINDKASLDLEFTMWLIIKLESESNPASTVEHGNIWYNWIFSSEINFQDDDLAESKTVLTHDFK